MPHYQASISEFHLDGSKPAKTLVSGQFENFKDLELALERGLKASIIPRKKKAPAKKVAKKKAKK